MRPKPWLDPDTGPLAPRLAGLSHPPTPRVRHRSLAFVLDVLRSITLQLLALMSFSFSWASAGFAVAGLSCCAPSPRCGLGHPASIPLATPAHPPL